MGKLNAVYPPYDKKVKFEFIWTAPDDLNSFTELRCIIGGETYSTTTTATELYIESPTVLVLDIGAVTSIAIGSTECPNILGFDASNPNGIPLNVESANKLDPVKFLAVC